jgi:hypothetical protein
LGGYSSQEDTVDIDNLSVSLKKDRYWAGFSGSPVFAGGKLAAVVRSVNIGERGAGLVASFLCPALDAEGDKEGQGRLRHVPEFFVPPDNSFWKERIRYAVIGTLEHHKEVYEGIKDEYLKLEKQTSIRNESDLVDALVRTPEEHVIKCFHRVFTSMQRRKTTSGVRAMEYLARVWLTLLAATHSSIEGIDTFKNDPSAKPFAMNAVEPIQVDVEAQAAHGERREPQLQLSGRGLRSPMDLTPDHKTGLDAHDRQAAKDVVATYESKTRPGLEAFKVEDVKDELEQFATRPETGLSGPIAPEDDAKRGRMIADQLDWDYDELGGSVYIRIPKVAETGESSDLRDLHQWCPQLLLFEVTKYDNSERLIKCMTGLYRIIYNAQQFLDDEINA